MVKVINAKHLRAHLQEVVTQVSKGSRFTVLYRSRPAFEIVPVGSPAATASDLESDPLFNAQPVGSSAGGDAARRHDEALYR